MTQNRHFGHTTGIPSGKYDNFAYGIYSGTGLMADGKKASILIVDDEGGGYFSISRRNLEVLDFMPFFV